MTGFTGMKVNEKQTDICYCGNIVSLSNLHHLIELHERPKLGYVTIATGKSHRVER